MRVLVYYSKLNYGGAERSNIRLIKKMLDAGWDVDLVLRYSGGNLERELSKGVNIFYLRDNKLLEIKQQKNLISRCRDIAVIASGLATQKRAEKKIKKNKYDIAIIGLQGLDAGFVVKKVKASVRILWIRNDLSKCDPNGKVGRNILKYGNSIDYFPCVSRTAEDAFKNSFPQFSKKSILFYNILNPDDMRKRQNEPSCIDGKYANALKVLSVCRISDRAKGVFRMLNIYERLRKDGIFFYWILAGDGTDFQELKMRAHEKGLDDGFILLGNQDNPYPLYRQCDLVAVLSYYEGLCGTVNEAKIIGCPVIATEFSGIHEQITNGVNGLIVENNEDSAYEGMKRLLENPELRNHLTNTILPKEIYDDDYKLAMLKDMVGNGESRIE